MELEERQTEKRTVTDRKFRNREAEESVIVRKL